MESIRSEAMKHTYHKKLNPELPGSTGGNGTHKTANLLREEKLNVITLPGAIDNDLWGTDYDIWFQSAVDIATQIDQIHTTAASHGRVLLKLWDIGGISDSECRYGRRGRYYSDS